MRRRQSNIPTRNTNNEVRDLNTKRLFESMINKTTNERKEQEVDLAGTNDTNKIFSQDAKDAKKNSKRKPSGCTKYQSNSTTKENMLEGVALYFDSITCQ